MSGPVDIVTGTRPDGAPWVIGVDFSEDVRVDGFGRLWLRRRQVSPQKAKDIAAALVVAARWIENDSSAALEAEMARERQAVR